jgi:anaerobic selenocysteine-containing dehydrogenase
VDDIVRFARLYGSTPRSYLRLGYGFTRQRNGSAAMHAVSCLPAITGAWQHRGGGALYSNGGLYGLDMRFLHGLDAAPPPARQLDMGRLGAVLAASARPGRWPAGERDADPEHQPGGGRPRQPPGARGAHARRPLRVRA